jgi:uncharacterized protein (TIGR01777 family)
MENLQIVIAGGSGFIGQAMAERWGAANKVTILSRMNGTANNNYSAAQLAGVHYLQWDGRAIGKWATVLDGADMLINLAGKSVNCRYNEANKAEILNSRVDATRILGQAVLSCKNPPRLWTNGASATIYPHATATPRDESFTAFADDFSVQVCKAWEAAFNAISVPHTRKAILRMAIVLGRGGAMVPYRRLTKLGLGGRQGSGRQMFSWIHIDDLCRMVEWLWLHEEQQGIYNASAPNPVTNEDFMKAVRQSLHVPFGLPAPAWMLKLGAAIIGTETELLLKSRWVLPARLQEAGFTFQFPELRGALAASLPKA